MVTDIQVRKLKKYLGQGKTLEVAAARAGMDEKTGRKYRGVTKGVKSPVDFWGILLTE